jgi:hypothetical protein
MRQKSCARDIFCLRFLRNFRQISTFKFHMVVWQQLWMWWKIYTNFVERSLLFLVAKELLTSVKI